MPELSREIRFMGAVTALTMHEMQNVLAIIRESAGLMGDILRVNANVAFKYRENMERSLEHIRTHVERGKGLLEATSRLAHSPDNDQLDRCDLAVCTRTVAHLAERPARLKCTSVELQPCQETLPVKVGALAVIMAGYQAVICAAGISRSKDSVIHLSLEKGNAWHVLVVRYPQGMVADDSGRKTLSQGMLAMGGCLEETTDALRLCFPVCT